MPDNKLNAQFTWTFDEYKHVLYVMQNNTFGKFRLFLWGFIVVLLGAMFVYKTVNEGFDIYYLLPIAVVLLVLFVLQPYMRNRLATTLYKQQQLNGKTVGYLIENGVFSAIVNGTTNNSIALEKCYKAVLTERGILLHPTAQAFIWVPKHAFNSPNDADIFEQLVRDKVRT